MRFEVCAPAGKMAPAKPMERSSSFAMACNLLSRYVRENGPAAGELGLGIRGEPCFLYLVEEKFEFHFLFLSGFRTICWGKSGKL